MPGSRATSSTETCGAASSLPHESVGDVIHRDAIALARLGISRHVLADRLQLAIDIGRHNADKRRGREAEQYREQRLLERIGAPRADGCYDYALSFGYTSFAGIKPDPFHSVSGAPCSTSDFHIENPQRGLAISGSELVVGLIERYGFFEGDVRTRVDPAEAAWVLGLTDVPPAVLGSQPIAVAVATAADVMSAGAMPPGATSSGAVPPPALSHPHLITDQPLSSRPSWWRRLAARITSR